MIHHSISSQYITKNRINVTILHIIDPAHFVVEESPDLANESSVATSFLEAEAAMQKYYDSLDPGFIQLPLKDAIIVVLHEGKFYRARVIKILTKSAGHLLKVYLVDYGIECTVPTQNIYQIEKDFDYLEHPFQAVTIELLGIKPYSLVMDNINVTVAYGPVSSWDPSTLIYLKDLRKSMCSAYIEVQGVDDSQLHGKLFLCFESSPTICINDDMTSKSYAYFDESCWKNIETIENVLERPNRKSKTYDYHSEILNENSDQAVCTGSVTEMEYNLEDIVKVKFIDPVDGKILSESSLSAKNYETADEIPMLENESIPLQKTMSLLPKSEAESPTSVEEKAIDTGITPEKTFMKLRKLKIKSVSPCKVGSIDDTVSKSSATIIMTEKNIPTDLCQDKPEITNECLHDTMSNTSCQPLTPNSTLNETAKNIEENCWSDSVNSKALNKRFMKLRQQNLKGKSLSFHKSNDINLSGGQQELLKTTVSEAGSNTPAITEEISHHIETLNKTLSKEMVLSETQRETLDETVKNVQEQDNQNLVLLEHQKHFQKMRRKVLLKKKEPLLSTLNQETNQFQKYDELCDSDSGYNYSSSSSTSEKIE